MASILDRNRIEYDYSVWFETRGGGRREVDFMLTRPQRVYWFDGYISAIEVKGVLDWRSWEQQRELREVGIATIIVTEPIIRFWERERFLKTK
jgi:hypothetical protein